jgi:protein-tyrosine-phosphatase
MASKSMLIVCTGNTCRSPMAAAIAHGLWGGAIDVQSAGIEAASGMPATQNAVKVMAERGLDIREHKAQPVESVDLSRFVLIIAMTLAIAATLRQLGIDDRRILVINVCDPYGFGLPAYRTAVADIEAALRTGRAAIVRARHASGRVAAMYKRRKCTAHGDHKPLCPRACRRAFCLNVAVAPRAGAVLRAERRGRPRGASLLHRRRETLCDQVRWRQHLVSFTRSPFPPPHALRRRQASSRLVWVPPAFQACKVMRGTLLLMAPS